MTDPISIKDFLEVGMSHEKRLLEALHRMTTYNECATLDISLMYEDLQILGNEVIKLRTENKELYDKSKYLKG